MKFNQKQIDDFARLFTTLAASSIVGAIVGYNRTEQVSNLEVRYMIGSAVVALSVALLLRVE
jgi:hypothetical protein